MKKKEKVWKKKGPYTNRDSHVFEGEKNDMPSVTQPDMTLSLRELVKRHVRGGEVPTFTGVYDDLESFEGEDLSKFDRVQLAMYTRNLQAEVERAEEYLKYQKAQKKAAEKVLDEKDKKPSNPGTEGEAERSAAE